MTKKTAAQMMRDPVGPVTVEYDAKGQRASKTFEDAAKGKSFYAAKDKAGKKPKIVNPATEPEAATPAEEAKEPTPAPATTDKPAKAQAPTVPGVRETKSRSYWAGFVIAKHGLQAGVTAAMVAEVDKLFGKTNLLQSKFDTSCAWHCLNGYLNGATKTEGK